MRGEFIVIEGTDCSGKETQTTKLIERLQANGHEVEHMTFPRYDTPTGKIIGECYLGKNQEPWFENPTELDPKIASLYYAADRLHAVPFMTQTLDSGKHIICDRYVESNMGHQGGKAKSREERVDIIQYIDNLEYGLLELPLPDLVLFLYMPFEVGMELKKGRAGKADAHEASVDHLRDAENSYLELAKSRGWKMIECAPDRTMESLRTIEDIHKEVYGVVKELL